MYRFLLLFPVFATAVLGDGQVGRSFGPQATPQQLTFEVQKQGQFQGKLHPDNYGVAGDLKVDANYGFQQMPQDSLTEAMEGVNSALVGVAFLMSLWYILGCWRGWYPLMEKTKPKSRSRRAIEKNSDMTQLATMVLESLHSGECLQQSICLVATKMNGSKGRFAMMILDKMIPVSLQYNQYYVTLKRSMKEGNCDKYHCNYH